MIKNKAGSICREKKQMVRALFIFVVGAFANGTFSTQLRAIYVQGEVFSTQPMAISTQGEGLSAQPKAISTQTEFLQHSTNRILHKNATVRKGIRCNLNIPTNHNSN
jgi:hypothetical protein